MPVTVTVYDPNTSVPASGLPVAFLNADNSVVLEVVTDENGSASAVMVAGGSVTVGAAQVGSDGNGDPGNMYTWIGVKPGDALVANQPAIPNNPATVTVNVSTDTDANATDYEISIFCSDGESFTADPSDGGPTAIMVSSTCGVADLYDDAEDANGDELDIAYQGNVALSDGANITLGAFTAEVTDTITATNIPSSIHALNASFLLVDGVNALEGRGAKLTSSNGTAMATVQLGALANLNILTQFLLSPSATGNDNRLFAISSSPSINTGLSEDLSTVTSIASVQSEPAYDMSSSTFSWMETGTVAADVVAIAETVTSDDGSTRNFVWNVVGEDTSASLVLPTLPASLSNFTILSTDTITYTEASTIKISGGYDAIRNTVFGTENPQSSARGIFDISALSSSAQYVLQEFQD